MTPSFASSLDALSGWRNDLAQRLGEIVQTLAGRDVLDAQTTQRVVALRDRVGQDKLVVAFVAEFSRGKSELINAIFFGDTGRRILPATPGRTTMCPVELGWAEAEPPALQLLPIETRLEGLSLAELRPLRDAWRQLPLPVDDAARLSDAVLEVTRTIRVDVDRARALGFWDDAHPEANPPVEDDGRLEVPAWRHALINYPHPMLKQGLVVLDTPGLNAIGAEPELTLGLLPTAHAIVFMLGADTGVTRSDLDVWRDHLGAQARFVVLNKIDALADPLATAQQVEAQIAAQCATTARTLGIEPDRVFPLSAREALTARVNGDAAALRASRLPALEAALVAQLLPQRQQVLERVVVDTAQQVEDRLARRVGDQRRQLAEQMLELRGLRGKSDGRVRLLLQRVDAEAAEFEACGVRLQALRAVHGRMLKEALAELSADRLRDEVGRLQDEMKASLLNFGARKAFIAMCARLRAQLELAERRSAEIRDMLGASFARLNGEFGFGLATAPLPTLQRCIADLGLIEARYVQYLGLSQALRLSQPKFIEQFRRMLVSKLRVVFETATGEVEVWNRSASSQLESQLRERRRTFRRRRESLERVQLAAGDLETRIAELESQDAQLQAFAASTRARLDALRERARGAPVVDAGAAAPVAPADGARERACA